MAFREWSWRKKLLVILGILVLIALVLLFPYMGYRLTKQKEEVVVITDKSYLLLPIAVLAKPEEYLLDNDLLKNKDGKVIAIKYEALQRITKVQPLTLDDLARIFELLAREEDTLEARSTRQSLAELTKKTLLADKDLTEKLRGQPGPPGKAGRDSQDGKVDEALVSRLIDKNLAGRPSPKETAPVIKTIDLTEEKIAALKAELLAELEKRLKELIVTRKTTVTGGSKLRIGGEE